MFPKESQIFNPISDEHFQRCSWMGEKGLYTKICHIYPTMMKLGTVIPYLRKTRKTYKSSDTVELC